MYQYILFDLDGTLTDSREGITKSVQYALDKMGIHEPELKPLERFIGPPLYDEFRRSYGFDDAEAKQAIEFYRERFGVIGLEGEHALQRNSGVAEDPDGRRKDSVYRIVQTGVFH